MVETSYLDKKFESSSYHQYRPSYSDSLIKFLVNSYHKGNNDLLVDVGCGTGLSTFSFEPFFKSLVGVDPSTAMLKCAIENYQTDKMKFKEGFGENITELFKEESIDMVVAGESLQWCDMPKAFKQVFQILKPNGTFAFWFYSQPEFCSEEIDIEKFNEVYYKYGWGPEYMGSYLNEYQRKFFTQIEETSHTIIEQLTKQKFHDIKFEMSSYSRNLSDESRPFYMTTMMSINDLKNLVKTWSLYHSWVRDHPDDTKDIADVFVDEIIRTCNIRDADKKYKVQWTTFYYVCRKYIILELGSIKVI